MITVKHILVAPKNPPNQRFLYECYLRNQAIGLDNGADRTVTDRFSCELVNGTMVLEEFDRLIHHTKVDEVITNL